MRDQAGDYFRGSAFVRAVQLDTWEQLGFEEVEKEHRTAVKSAVQRQPIADLHKRSAGRLFAKAALGSVHPTPAPPTRRECN